MNYFRRFRDAAICVALLALPFLFLKANLKDPGNASFLDRMLLQASAPIQYVATEAAHSVSGLLEHYVYLVEVKQNNERLREDQQRLIEENRELRVAARENKRLRELLGLRERFGGQAISARVIGKEMSPFPRVVRIRLDRGERDHVKEGRPVVSPEGLVGQVRRTWGRYSDVLLTVDRASKIDVVIARTGARGMLRGTGDTDRYLCRIQYMQRTDEVKVGDEVYTSGLGKHFPASILVGTVSRVERRDFGLYQQVEVTPAVNFSAVQEVLVLREGSPSEAVAEGDVGDLPTLPEPESEQDEALFDEEGGDDDDAADGGEGDGDEEQP